MKILGLNFKELNAVRNGVKGQLKEINNNLVVKSMELIDLPLAQSGKALNLTFQYTVDYKLKTEGSFGKIELVGEVILDDSKKTLTFMKKKWDKDKALDDDFKPIMQELSNASVIEALALSKKLLLPSPIPLPKLG